MRSVIGTGKRVLDLGCRDGSLTETFRAGNAVLGVDIDEASLARARARGIDTQAMDLHGSWDELQDRTFDAIVAGEVLEHVFFPERVLEKAYARLVPGGVFVGSVPNAFSLKNRLRYLAGTRRHTPLSDPTHITQFGAAELEAMLRAVFPRVRVSGIGAYRRLARYSPNWFAFDLTFSAYKPAHAGTDPA